MTLRLCTMLLAGFAIFCVVSTRARADNPPTPEDVRFFETRIRPLLAEKCLKCHGPDKQKGDLRLDSAAAVAKGGGSGKPLFVAGKPDESLILRAVRHADGVTKMPLDGKLKDSEIADLAAWVKRGAPFPPTTKIGPDPAKHWAFAPVRPVAVPEIRNPKFEIRNEIDRFIVAKLEAAGLKPAPPADRRTLIRRATFDLTGLPPSPEEVAAFVGDQSPDAYEKLIDRLLASPAYGERWGRHWLDLVRYADTAGENSDHPLPHAWRYRNWVIDAFNRDMPYDEFLRDQIAGDIRARSGPPDKYARESSRPASSPSLAGSPRHRQGHVPHPRGRDRHRRQGVPRSHHRLRPLPRPQVRPDHREGLLRPLRHTRQHAIRVPGCEPKH